MQDILVWTIDRGALHAVQLSPPPKTLDQASELLPGGAYTTFRTYQRTNAVRLDDHLSRLEETAGLAGQAVSIDRAGLRQALRQAIRQAPDWPELRLRLTIDLQGQVGWVYVLAAALEIPSPEAYQQGVKVITTPLQRSNPKAKLTGSIQRAEQVRSQMAPGVHEALMLGGDGRILEGLSSNFFAVKSGEVWTAEDGVLSGITRALVLQEIKRAGIPLRLSPVTIDELPFLNETFITSSSRAVLPVRQVDDLVIGGGSPGPLTQGIACLYKERISVELEPI